MRSSVLLALASGLLAYALPTALNTSLNAVNARLQWTPDLPYPTGDSVATCPLDSGPNPLSTLEVPERKERSFTTATYLRRRNEICRQIIYGNLEHYSHRIYLTQKVLLIAGVTYVFSWAMNTVNPSVQAWRYNQDRTFTIIQVSSFNTGRGTMTLNMNQTAHIRFIILFDLYPNVSGEYALFQIGPD